VDDVGAGPGLGAAEVGRIFREESGRVFIDETTPEAATSPDWSTP
jgi:hypothetical protein